MDTLAEIYMRDEAVINEFLDTRHDLPVAVVDALFMRLVTLKDFIKMMEETETPQCAETMT